MTDTPTPRVPHAKLMTLAAEAEMEEWPVTSAWYWPRMLALDLRDSRALAQSQAATIAERDAEIERLRRQVGLDSLGVNGVELLQRSYKTACERLIEAKSTNAALTDELAVLADAYEQSESALASVTERLARAEAALKSALPQAEGCFANHYGDNPEGATEPEHIRLMRAALTPTKES